MESCRRLELPCLLAVPLLLLFAGCAPRVEPPAESASAPVAVDPVERGRYLVTIGVCGDCHTPLKMGDQGPAPDPTRFLSGHPADAKLTMPAIPEGWGAVIATTNTAFAGPWGISYAANLTPDPTGIGNITEEMFVEAMRTGQHYGIGRPILPPMPWPSIGAATDEDLMAMFAYLKSVPPIENVVPDPGLPPAEPPTR